jgi:hypothetical protein
MAYTYRELKTAVYPYGIETTIAIDSDGIPVLNTIVMNWPASATDKKKRADKLAENYEADLAEAARPAAMISRVEVETLLKAKGLLDNNKNYEQVKSKAEIKAEPDKAIKAVI